MDINLLLEGRGYAALTPEEGVRLLPYPFWSVKVCAVMTVKARSREQEVDDVNLFARDFSRF